MGGFFDSTPEIVDYNERPDLIGEIKNPIYKKAKEVQEKYNKFYENKEIDFYKYPNLSEKDKNNFKNEIKSITIPYVIETNHTTERKNSFFNTTYEVTNSYTASINIKKKTKNLSVTIDFYGNFIEPSGKIAYNKIKDNEKTAILNKILKKIESKNNDLIRIKEKYKSLSKNKALKTLETISFNKEIIIKSSNLKKEILKA